MTHIFDSGIHDLAVCKYCSSCFAHIYRTLVDAWTFRKSIMLLAQLRDP